MLLAILAFVVLPECTTAAGQFQTVALRRATSTFAFASNPWLNEYNFLAKLGKDARGIHDDGLGARGYVAADTASIRSLTSSEAAAWKNAVDFFARVVVRDQLGVDSLVQNINDVLARTPADAHLDETSLPPNLAAVVEEVMPIYRSAWWPTHDRRNREWIASMQARLADHEDCIARWAQGVFRAPWPTPIHVDATVYANWFGAYSEHHPTRVTVAANANGAQGDFGLETLIHETGHGMLAPLDSTLAREAVRQHKSLPPELSHLVLFYTAGALMKQQTAGYVSFADAFGVWRRNAETRRLRGLIERAWLPYLAGTRTFDESVAALVRGL